MSSSLIGPTQLCDRTSSAVSSLSSSHVCLFASSPAPIGQMGTMGSSTKVQIASFSLLVERLWPRLVLACRSGLLLYLFFLPLAPSAAKNLVLFGGGSVAFVLRLRIGNRRLNLLGFENASERVVVCLVWLGLVVLVHRDGSSAAIPFPLTGLALWWSTSFLKMVGWPVIMLCLYRAPPRLLNYFRGINCAVEFLRDVLVRTSYVKLTTWILLNKDLLCSFANRLILSSTKCLVYGSLIRGLEKYVLRTDHLDFLDFRLYRFYCGFKFINSWVKVGWRHGVIWTADEAVDGISQLHYKRLGEPRNIRLLLVRPWHHYGPVKCSFVEVSLDKVPRYEAISYTWGNPMKRSAVSVNDRPFNITANAHDILRGRSSSLLPRLLWIDSVCINQEDNYEKTNQVRMIKDIYQKAFLVTVWMGQNRWPTSITDELHFSIDAYWASRQIVRLREAASQFPRDSPGLFNKLVATRRSTPWFKFVEFLKHPWFERIWVVQEVALASSIRVVYGDREIAWQEMVEVFGILTRDLHIQGLLQWTEDPKVRQVPPPSIHNVLKMNFFRQSIQRGSDLPFPNLILASRRFKATDLRDKVFGIHGICSHSTQRLIHLDYTASLEQVYTETAKSLISGHHYQLIFATAGVGYFETQVQGLETLPSWAPDWSRTPKVVTLADHDTNQSTNIDHTSPHLSQNEKTLITSGHLIDVIDELSPAFNQPAGDEAEKWGVDCLPKFCEPFTKSYSLLMQSTLTTEPYPFTLEPQTLREAYWRSLIGDRAHGISPAPARFADGFAALERYVHEMAEGLNPGISADSEIFQASREALEFMPLMVACTGRRFCVTRRGYIGFVPPYARAGDEVYAVLGAQTPLVLRPVTEKCEHRALSSAENEAATVSRLVGECYVHGVEVGPMLHRLNGESRIALV